MANTTDPSHNSLEKEPSVFLPNPPLEDSKSEEQSDATLDQNEHPIFDETGIKSPTEPPLARNGSNAELPPEPPVEQPGSPGKDYSSWAVTQKRLILVTASFASLFSPMATAIYCE
jgi:hypothetical protein